MPIDVFLSYAAADKDTASAVLAGLEANGVRCWIAPRDIPAGSEYGQQIVEAIKACRIFVVIFSASANSSHHVRREVERAVSAQRIIVPFRIENIVPTGGMEYALSNTHWLDAMSTSLEQHIATLVSIARKMLGSGATTGPEPSALPAHAAKPSIVVLPFNNMSGDPEQEYFSDGITEDIITDLSKVSALSVISRNSAFMHKGKNVDLPKVARELKVSHVLEGSVRKSGGRVRITAQLIDGATNDHIWAERYDRDLSDIFTLQDEISQAIVKALKLKLLPEEKRYWQCRQPPPERSDNSLVRARHRNRPELCALLGTNGQCTGAFAA